MFDYNNGEPQRLLSKDEMLELDVTLYWLTNTPASSARLYWETSGQSVLLSAAQKTAEISIPVAISVFPEEVWKLGSGNLGSARLPQSDLLPWKWKRVAILRRGKNPNGSVLNCERRSDHFGRDSYHKLCNFETPQEVAMKTIRMITLAAAVLLGGMLSSHIALSQQPGIKCTDLQRHDLSVPGRGGKPGAGRIRAGRVVSQKYSHPGEEIVYIVAGSLEYALEGKPPVTLNAGEVLFIPAGTAHAVRNVGSGNASELATYIVEKGKPLLTLSK